MVLDGRTLYEAEWRADGKEVEITVTPEGEIVGREVEEPDDEEHGDPED